MKTLIATFATAIALSTSVAFADDNKTTQIKNTLPAATPALETPAPPTAKTVNAYNQYTPAQKAAIVELKIAK